MTKLFPFALAAALLATAGAASAASPSVGDQQRVFHSDFSGDRSDSDGLIEFRRIEAPAAGVVEVYDYRLGQLGDLRGSDAMNAGRTWNVRVNIGMAQRHDMLAVYKVNGQIVDQRVIGHNNY